MANDPNTEWVIVRHTRIGPVFSDEVQGRYATEADATQALNQMLHSRPWFTEFSLEHRIKLSSKVLSVLRTSGHGPKPGH